MDEILVKLNNSIEKLMEEYPRRIVLNAVNELLLKSKEELQDLSDKLEKDHQP